MRVGGPYTVQVVYIGGGGAAFAPKTVENINVNLGVITDVNVSVEAITVAEEVEVTGAERSGLRLDENRRRDLGRPRGHRNAARRFPDDWSRSRG